MLLGGLHPAIPPATLLCFALLHVIISLLPLPPTAHKSPGLPHLEETTGQSPGPFPLALGAKEAGQKNEQTGPYPYHTL